jgi:spore maturation protein CgeB
MKILYIALKYDYGIPKRGYSYEHNNFYDSLVRMGNGKHTVIYFAFDEIMRALGKDAMNKRLLEIVEKERPELCFFFIFTDEIKKETIKKITDSGNTITFNWFADDHWRFRNYSKYWATLFNWVSTTDSQAPDKYKKIGYNNVIKTQWACNQFLYKKTKSGIKHDITFIGQAHSNRREIIDRLRKFGISVECWGSGWPNGRILQNDMVRLFSESRINLNLTTSSGTLKLKPIVKIFFNRRVDDSYQLVNPKLWAANIKSFLIDKRREQIKGRNFEVPGCGGFLLTGDADNLRDYYKDGEEIVIFNSTEDLIYKAKYYLGHEKERNSIADTGYMRTVSNHTYERRFNEIFKTIGVKQ